MTSIESIVNRQLLKWELEKREVETKSDVKRTPAPIVTISRESGSRGSYFGSRLAGRLGYQRLHREAIDVICRTSGYLRRVIESLDEHSRSQLELTMEAFLTGQAVDHSDYAKQLCRVVLSMSELGGIVLMGRGGNVILGPRRGFHIRVICPKKKRIENLVKYKQIDADEAKRIIEMSDRDRREFIATLCDEDIDNPRLYDLVVNTAYMDIEELTDVAVVAIKAKMDKLTHLGNDPK